jgi:hypothetical protein
MAVGSASPVIAVAIIARSAGFLAGDDILWFF